MDGVAERGRALGRGALLLASAVLLLGVYLFERRAHARTFTEQDSVNFALALRHFDVRLDQPHPPGYPLFVLAAHGLHPLGSTLTAYLACDLVASLATVAATYSLARTMFDGRAGVIAAALLVATPLFLYYSQIVSVYPSEELFAPLVALLAYQTARGGRTSAFLLLPLLGLGAGLRPTMLALLLPVCIVAIVLGRPGLRTVLGGAVLAGIIVLLWAIPALMKSGGLHGYLDASSSLYGGASSRTSVLHGATLRQAYDNVWLVVVGTLVTALPALLLVAIFARRLRRPSQTAFLILAGWIVPYVVFYAVGHFGKPGYLMAYLPALYVGAAGLVSRARLAVPVSLAIAAMGAGAFVFADHIPLPSPLAQREMPPFVPTAAVIALQDTETRSLARLSSTCPAGTCVIVSLPGTPLAWDHSPFELRRWYAPQSRLLSYAANRDAVEQLTGNVLWVGRAIPPAVESYAQPVDAAGSWRYLRSRGQATARILAEN